MSKSRIEELVESLSELTVLEMAELKTALEDKWGVKAAAGVATMAAMPVAGDQAEAAEESTEFEVTLADVSAQKKIAVIKVVREITGLGLKEAKAVAEEAPKVLKDSVSKTEAEEIQKKVEEAGGKVTLKGL